MYVWLRWVTKMRLPRTVSISRESLTSRSSYLLFGNSKTVTVYSQEAPIGLGAELQRATPSLMLRGRCIQLSPTFKVLSCP